MVEGIELHNVSKSRGLMPFAQQKATFYPSLRQEGKTSLESETLARYTLYDTATRETLPVFFFLEKYGVQAIISKETKCRVGSRIAA